VFNGGKEYDNKEGMAKQGIGNLEQKTMLVACKWEDGEVVIPIDQRHLKAISSIRHEYLKIVRFIGHEKLEISSPIGHVYLEAVRPIIGNKCIDYMMMKNIFGRKKNNDDGNYRAWKSRKNNRNQISRKLVAS
jgi:hypothetical protein